MAPPCSCTHLALALALVVLSPALADDVCQRQWNDYCPGAGGSCTPFAPPLPSPTDWLALRGALVDAVFGRSDGQLPSAGVDATYALALADGTSLIGNGGHDIVAITVGTDSYVFIDSANNNTVGLVIKLTGVAASSLGTANFTI